MRTLWLMLAGLIAAPLPAAEPDAGQAAYAAGDFVGAIERWQAQVVAEGATAGRLAALGNAEWKLGRKGRAMVCWERALLLDPRNAVATAGIRHAQSAGGVERPALTWAEDYAGFLGANAWLVIATAAFWVALLGLLIPRLRQFTEAYPEIDLTLQVSIPLLDVVAEDADLMVRFGAGRYADLEHVCITHDVVTPMASPEFLRQHGPFETPQSIHHQSLLRSPLEPWRTWFAAHDLDWPEPTDGSSFNDIGLMCDAAAAGMGIAPVRLKLGAPWLENGSLVRLGSSEVFTGNVPSPHAHYLCWRTGMMDSSDWETCCRDIESILSLPAVRVEWFRVQGFYPLRFQADMARLCFRVGKADADK